MKILIACEYSGKVREAFRKLGHDAWSCDLLPADDGSEFHIQGDVTELLDGGWDLMVAFPARISVALGCIGTNADPDAPRKQRML